MTTDQLDPNAQPDLRSYLQPVWDRKWLIVLLVALVAGGTYAYYDRQPRIYDTQTKIFVGKSEASGAINPYGDFASDRTVQNVATLLQTRELSKRVQDRLDKEKLTAGGFVLTPVKGSDFVIAAATAGSPNAAAATANAVAQEFVDLRSDRERETLTLGLREREEQLKALPKGVSAAAERASVSATIQQLKLALSLPTGGAEVVDEAFPPAAATSPKPRRNAIFAFALALVAGISLAFGLARFDRRLKSVEDVRANYSNPILAVIPRSGDTKSFSDRGNAVDQDLREPFRDLLTNIQLMSVDSPVRRLLVTSAVPGEGKSTVTRNLAIVLREYGLSVAVVDADLRRPTQVELMHGSENEHQGLSTVLTGQSTLEEALIEVPVDVRGLETLRRIRVQSGSAPGAWGDDEVPADLGGLHLLSAGPLPANPQAVLAAARTREVIEELGRNHDIVIIDSPPLLAVSDSVPLLTEADAVILVSRLGVATRDTARRLLELLGRVPGKRWVGIVANDLRVGGSGYSYGYAYGYKAKRRRRLEGDEAGVDRRWWQRRRAPNAAESVGELERTLAPAVDEAGPTMTPSAVTEVVSENSTPTDATAAETTPPPPVPAPTPPAPTPPPAPPAAATPPAPTPPPAPARPPVPEASANGHPPVPPNGAASPDPARSTRRSGGLVGRLRK